MIRRAALMIRRMAQLQFAVMSSILPLASMGFNAAHAGVQRLTLRHRNDSALALRPKSQFCPSPGNCGRPASTDKRNYRRRC